MTGYHKVSGCVVCFLLCAHIAGAALFTENEPTFIRSTGAPIYDSVLFSVYNPATNFILKIQNGPPGYFRISSAEVWVNGTKIVLENELNEKVEWLQKSITVNKTNNLKVYLRSKPGGAIKIFIQGIDNEPPTISILSPSNGLLTNNNTPSISIIYNDVHSGIVLDSLRIFVNGADKTAYFTKGASSAAWTIPPGMPLPEGENIVKARICDRAGNCRTTENRFSIDTTPPHVVITNPGQDTIVNISPLSVGYTIDSDPRTRRISLTEGLNKIIIDSIDQAGNRGADTVKVTLDTQAPEVKITSPENGQLTNHTTITVIWTIDGVSQTAQLSESLTEDTNIITRSSTDAAGNIGTTSIKVVLDTKAPEVTITSPINGLQTNHTPVNISWTVDGVTQTTQLTQPLMEGANTITRSETDAVGNVGTASVTVTLDTNPPVVVITSPANGLLTNKTPVAVAWTVDGIAQTAQLTQALEDGANTVIRSTTDAAGNTGTASITVTLDTKPPVVAITSPVNGLLTNHMPVNISWTVDGVSQSTQLTQALDEGTNTITRSATDAAGNTGSVAITVTLDTQAPVVTITSPVNGTIVNQSPIEVAWTIDNVVQTTKLSESLVEGPNTIIRTATDAAGNTGADTITVNLDYHVPVVEITFPPEGYQATETPVRVTWTVDNVPQTSQQNENLVYGANRIIRSTTTPFGKVSSDTVVVNLAPCVTYENTTVTLTGDHYYSCLILINSSITHYGKITAGNISVRNNSNLFMADSLKAKYVEVLAGGNISHLVAQVQGGMCTVYGLNIIADTLNIQNGGKIDVSGRGYPNGYGISGQNSYWGNWDRGGSHGGLGFNSFFSAYGNYLQPAEAGSGGGSTYLGGPGGGIIRINVHEKLLCDGLITANGIAQEQGDGAGGSIWIHSNEILGTGTIMAKGGNYMRPGGGGRIAIYANDMSGTWLNNLSTSGYGCGTIYLQDGHGNHELRMKDGSQLYTSVQVGNADTLLRIKLSNGSKLQITGDCIAQAIESKNYSELKIFEKCRIQKLSYAGGGLIELADTLSIDSCFMDSNTILTHRALTADSIFKVLVKMEYFDLKRGAKIDVSGKGYPNGCGINGKNSAWGNWDRGGSHAGKGFNAFFSPYGNYQQPENAGAGGGTIDLGGSGGGIIRLIISGAFICDGKILANGVAHTQGDGAGGSIWITADKINGEGSMEAKGGNYMRPGGGGRIAIYATDMSGTWMENLYANGYGIGTIYLQDGHEYRELQMNGQSQDYTVVTEGISDTLVNISLRNGSKLLLSGNCKAKNIQIINLSELKISKKAQLKTIKSAGGGLIELGDSLFVDSCFLDSNTTLTHKTMAADSVFRVAVNAKHLEIKLGAKIDVSGKGYPNGCGISGQNTAWGNWNKGGSHGGVGFNAFFPAYDNYLQPENAGSGGGSINLGGPGGGIVRLIINGTLLCDGKILANGVEHTQGDGAGGSIWITANQINGTGSIEAKGGNYMRPGGGGRIALYCCSIDSVIKSKASVMGYQVGSLHLPCSTGIIQPIVEIKSPVNGFETNKNKIDVEWYLDGVRQTSRTSEPLIEGKNIIVRTVMNALGYVGTDTVYGFLDTKPPVVKITSPTNGIYTNNKTIPVLWTLDGVDQSSLTIETLNIGENLIVRSVTDSAGNRGSDSVTVTLDTTSPVVKILSPSGWLLTNKPRLHVLWSLDGVSRVDTTKLVNGNNSIIRRVVDLAGNIGSDSVGITLDTIPPMAKILSPRNDSCTSIDKITIVWISDMVTKIDTSYLNIGQNIIIRSLKDLAGNIGSDSVRVWRDSSIHSPPKIVSLPNFQSFPGAVYTYLPQAIYTGSTAKWTLLHGLAGVSFDTTGFLEFVPNSIGSDSFSISITDQYGQSDIQNFVVEIVNPSDAECSSSSIILPDFLDTSMLKLNGSTAKQVPTIQTPQLRIVGANYGGVGSAFLKGKLALYNENGGLASFSTFFALRISNPFGFGLADGMCFVLQANSDSALGAGGGDLGYGGIGNSIATEFDVWFNWNQDPTYNSHHIGIDVGGSVYYSSTNSGANVPELSNGTILYCWVEYSAADSLYSVRTSNTTIRPEVPSCSYKCVLPALLHDSTAWLGFTAATGAGHADHDILSWVIYGDYYTKNSCHIPWFTTNPYDIIEAESLYTYQPQAQDDIGSIMKYSIITGPSGMSIDSLTGRISWRTSRQNIGRYKILVAADNGRRNGYQSFYLSVVPPSGSVPVITSAPNLITHVNKNYSYIIQSTNPNLCSLKYEIDQAPHGVVLEGNTLQWIPPRENIGSNYFMVLVSDCYGLRATQTFTLTVVGEQDGPPKFISTPSINHSILTDYSYNVEVTDQTQSLLQLISSPNGMTLGEINYSVQDSGTDSVKIHAKASVSWPVSSLLPGNYPVLISATDAEGLCDTQSYSLTITEVNNLPTFISIPPSAATQGSLYSYQAQAQDPDMDPLSYSLAFGPEGMSVSLSGLVQWTPTSSQVGVKSAVISVSDGIHSVIQQFSVNVANVNDGPIFVSTPLLSATIGASYYYQVRATDADNDPLTYSLLFAPEEMTISSSGLIEWPDNGSRQDNAYVAIQIRDPFNATAMQAWNIRIVADTVLPVVSILLSANPVRPGETAIVTVFATDNVGVASCGLTVAGTPVVLDVNRQYSFVPQSIGTIALSATATDLAGNLGSATAYLTVSNSADNTAPSVSLSYSPPNPRVGDHVIFTVTVTDNIGIDPERVWLKTDGVYIPVSNGQATYTAIKQGMINAIATAYDLSGNYGEDAETVPVLITGTDNTPPTVQITSPEADSVITGVADVLGTAFDANFAYYTLSYKNIAVGDFVEYYRAYSPVSNAFLGVIDATTLENGDYIIKLVVFDRYGNSGASQVLVRIDGNKKIGLFTLSFIDMNLSLPGLSLGVDRIYDSRVKSKSDFGIGWSLGLRSMKLSENCNQGTSWSFGLVDENNPISGYYLRESRPHTVIVTIPGGRNQVFKAVAHFFSKYNPTSGYFSYEPEPGTYSKLRQLDCDDFYTESGRFWDINAEYPPPEPFNPNRYELTLMDSTKYLIDQDAGGTVAVIDPNGNRIDLSSAGISHNAGAQFSFNRDGEGRISSMSDGTGRTISYTYDGHGNLQKVVDANGNITRFKYGPNSYLMEIIDPRGVRAMRTEYDEGRMVRQINPAGDTLTITHNLADNLDITKDFNGNETRYIYDDHGNVLNKTDAKNNAWTYEYDALDNLLRTVNPDNTHRSSTFDATGNELTSTNERNYTTTRTYGAMGRLLTELDPLSRLTRYEYDVSGNLVRSRGPNSRVTSEKTYAPNGNVLNETDGEGNVTSYGYDSQGRMTSKTDPLGRVTRYVLNDRGQTIADVTARGDSTKYFFDANGNQVKTINALGDSTTTEYNNFNKVSRQVDAKGNTTRFEYDIFGQLHKTIAQDSTFTRKTYDGQGNVKTTTDEAGRVTTFDYDQDNRVVKTTFNDGSFTNVEYDAMGRRHATVDANDNRTEYGYDAAGNNISVKDALNHVTRYEYDAANRRTAMVDALNHRTEYLYDDYDRLIKTIFHDGTYKTTEYDNAGRKTAETDQEGKRTVFSYDSIGNLRTVTDAMDHGTSYTYDTDNNRISQTDANNHATNMIYDALNRMVLRTYPNGEHEHFGFDANGNQTFKINGEGDSTVCSYDKRNREVMRRYSNSGHTVATEYTNDGKPDTIVDYRGTTIYTYTIRGQQACVNNPDGSFIRSYYDAQGNRTAEVTPFDSVAYGYDVLNRMQTVTASTGTTHYFFDAVGNRDSVLNANGTATGYHYDDLNRLVNVTNWGAGNTVISSYTYDLNKAGIRTAVEEADGSHVAYGYDASYKLTSETRTGTHPYSIFYAYDNVGNRLSQTKDGQSTSYVYNNRDQLTSETGPSGLTTYTYDHAGRMATKTDASGTVTYSWVDNDRMASVAGPGVLATYDYDAAGQRVSETTAGGTKKYLIDYQLPYGQVVAETDGNGNPVAGYVYGLDRISMTRGASTHTYVADGQGSIRGLTNGAGQVTDTYDYTAFGEELAKTGTTVNPFRYVGEAFDPNCGFYYNRARWYDPSNGRFTSVDPFTGDPQAPISLHQYLYANISPLNFVDPNGLVTLPELWASIEVRSILAAVSISITVRAFQFASDLAGGMVFASAFVDFAQGLTFDAAFTAATAGIGGIIPGIVRLIPFGSSGAAGEIPQLYTVYRSVNGTIVQYVGITINFARREAEHAARFEIEVLVSGLTKFEARGVEQALIELYKLRKYGGTLLNRINSISPKNEIYADALKRGKEILKGIGFRIEGF
jgi:RHS repeat-associated protein